MRESATQAGAGVHHVRLEVRGSSQSELVSSQSELVSLQSELPRAHNLSVLASQAAFPPTLRCVRVR